MSKPTNKELLLLPILEAKEKGIRHILSYSMACASVDVTMKAEYIQRLQTLQKAIQIINKKIDAYVKEILDE